MCVVQDWREREDAELRMVGELASSWFRQASEDIRITIRNPFSTSNPHAHHWKAKRGRA